MIVNTCEMFTSYFLYYTRLLETIITYNDNK